MKQPLPKKLARRIFAIRITATILGGAVLVVLLALLAMLYCWMNAKTQLISPDKLICPDVSAWVRFAFFDTDTRIVPVDILETATRGLPEPAANLVRKGLRDSSCPVVVVLSRTSGGERAMAINLGKYTGMFRLVSRELERRAEKRLLPYAIKYHFGTPIFFTEGADSSGLMPLAVRGTTFIQAPNTSGMERFLDWMNAPKQGEQASLDGISCFLYAKS